MQFAVSASVTDQRLILDAKPQNKVSGHSEHASSFKTLPLSPHQPNTEILQ